MLYQVSDVIQQRFQQLVSLPAVQKGLQYIEHTHMESIDEQIEFAMIEAPTFHEDKRAARFKEKLEAIGICDVKIDGNNNVDGFILGTERARILTEAHLDTVFPFGTTTEVRREGDMLYAPGIYDNARGIACLLSALRGIRISGLQLQKTLIVAGTSREEAEGSLGGMKDILDRYPDIEASISMDGGFLDSITYNATFNKTISYTFHGVGGHAFSAFGTAANPMSAACRAVARINDIQVPDKPRTPFATSKIYSCEKSSITSIPGECKLFVNFRSDSEDMFINLEQLIEQCVYQGCQDETERWRADTITFEKEELCYLPGGRQSAHLPLVEANYLCARYVGGAAVLRDSGNSNSNIPISRGIPAVTVGSSSRQHLAHSLDEQFCITGAYTGPQGLFLMLLMAAGIADTIPSCMG